jgi:rod shape-determining protein MreC
MRHISIEPPAFFHRGPAPIARLAFFGLISIALLFIDTRYHYLEGIRRVVAVALYPLQRAAQLPGELVSDIGRYFVSQQALTEENTVLKRQLVEQRRRAQAYRATQQEKCAPARAARSGSRYAAGASRRSALHRAAIRSRQKPLRRKGVDSEIQAGEAVIDADGVVGQVTRVYPYMAEVTLVTDKDHAVPVQVQRSGVRSVLYGSGAGRRAELRFMAPSRRHPGGDVLVTSGSTARIHRASRRARRHARRATPANLRRHRVHASGRTSTAASTLLVLGQVRRDAAASRGAGRGSTRRRRPGKGKRRAGDAVMALPNIGHSQPRARTRSCGRVRPWFIVATLASRFVGNLLPLSGVALGAASPTSSRSCCSTGASRSRAIVGVGSPGGWVS